MPLTASVSLNVPVLPESDIWFANSQAWTNYWSSIEVDATFDPIDNLIFAAIAHDGTLQPAYFEISGTEYILCTKAMFDNLKARVDAVESSYQSLRTELKDAGFLTRSQ